MLKKFGSTVAAAALILGAAVAHAGEEHPAVVKIATLSHHESGCSESSRTFVVEIPDAGRLDLNYKGVVAGIEVREVEANNGHSFGNIAFDGTKLTITLRAKGAGHRVSNPFNRGSVCVGAEGASEGVEI
jgi:hypothetical protein